MASEMSINAYARYRDCRPYTVQMAIKRGRIRLNANGKIDPDEADRSLGTLMILDHIERAKRSYIRNTSPDNRAHTVFCCGQDATNQKIGNFGRGKINDAGDHTFVNELFHGLPANACRVKNKAFIIAL